MDPGKGCSAKGTYVGFWPGWRTRKFLYKNCAGIARRKSSIASLARVAIRSEEGVG